MRRVWLAPLVLALIVSCSDAPSEKRSPTVDIPPPVEVETAEDQQSVEPEVSFAGVLPGSFPKDLPVYTPASLIDFGSPEEGGSFVDILSPHEVPRVRRAFLGALEEGGWSSAAGRDGELILSKGSRRVRLTIRDGKPGTLYRYEY